MHALVLNGPREVAYSTVTDAIIEHPEDAIVRVELAAICGSDLHVYRDHEKGCDHGTIMGHEFVGTIVETGNGVRRLSKGDRVMSPFTTNCGTCFYCKEGLTCRCEYGQLFGWVSGGKGLQGAQAEWVRVPMAESTLTLMSGDLSAEEGLLLGDVFSTGYYCAERAEVKQDGTYGVIGCGPVGLMAVVAALDLQAAQVYAFDAIPERLQMAAAMGAIPVNIAQSAEPEWILEHIGARGLDGVMEAVGNPSAARLAYNLVRPGGIISSVGVHTSSQFAFGPMEAYDKNLTYRSGRCPARYYMDRLTEKASLWDISRIITHRFALSDGKEAYRIFDGKQENCIKAVLLT